jgi:molybdopterin-guanine dinucleotide biosynthesis adapter protein
MRVIGLAGWSGAGKTTLIVKLIPALQAQGLSVSTLKHAHHQFDVDQPGKDSHRHREAGAHEVLIASENRFALMHELRGAPEPSLGQLIGRLEPVDLLLIEGFKQDPHAKLEVHRATNGKPFLFPDDPNIKALASDAPEAGVLFQHNLPYAHLDDIGKIVDLILKFAVPVEETLRRLSAIRQM